MQAIRVLHVVGAMNRGGVETWLMQVLRHIDRERFRLDFLVHTTQPAAFDEEIRALGSRIFPCPNPRNVAAYRRSLREILGRCGPYDVVHSHVHHFSGMVLRVAHDRGVPTRIAHSHVDTSGIDATASVFRKAYLRLMKAWIRRYATAVLAASQRAARPLAGRGGHDAPYSRILYYGLDLAPFSSPPANSKGRTACGLPREGFVIGHVGRFDTQKNHGFLLRVMQHVVSHDPNAWLLLLGDGPLRTSIERQAKALRIRDRVVFAGVRCDVPNLLMGAMDLMLFPSLFEGLPLAVLEAQAAGLPVVLADTVTAEVDVVPGLLTWLSLSQPESQWAETCLATRRRRHEIPQRDAREMLEKSPFNIRTSILQLQRLYQHDHSNPPDGGCDKARMGKN